ncbi:MAG TPA: SDR family NAD(P)-dependent oxidoreductase [Solirubrobacteraceae bacterium]|nr:SDR family NAD(P)-dependent oxidoreductase [Solirubrobacteraceae bacterium]
MTPDTLTATKQTPLKDLIDLTGRSAIVTGGAVGIGEGIVRRLHEAGANVIVADVDLHGANELTEELLAARPGSAVAQHADVSDLDSVRRMTATAVEAFGRLDILVNNAGIYPMASLADLDVETFRQILDVNLTGLFMCTKAAADQMIEQGRGGRIVNITSIDALHPSAVGLATYDASKHGAWGFTKNVALELAPHGIWVNAIAPGGIVTPGTAVSDQETLEQFAALIPAGRMGVPDDIARAALFLASDLSSYMTGSQVVVDGGRLLR